MAKRHPQLQVSPENKQWLTQELETKTQREIAEQIGSSAAAICLAAKRMGIKVPHRSTYRYADKGAAISAGIAKTFPNGRCGPDHPRWKGGKYRTKNGYIQIQKGRRRGYEHRWKMEELLGRPLLRKEEVHHVNGVASDNRTDGPLVNFRSGNLELWTKSHPAGQRVPDKVAWAIELLQLYAPQELASGERP